MSRLNHEIRNSLPNFSQSKLLIDFDETHHIRKTEGCPPDRDMSIETFLSDNPQIEAISERYRIRLSPHKDDNKLFEGELEVGDSTENFIGNLKNCYCTSINSNEKDWRITIRSDTVSFDLFLRTRYFKGTGTVEYVDSCFGKPPYYDRPKSLCISNF